MDQVVGVLEVDAIDGGHNDIAFVLAQAVYLEPGLASDAKFQGAHSFGVFKLNHCKIMVIKISSLLTFITFFLRFNI